MTDQEIIAEYTRSLNSAPLAERQCMGGIAQKRQQDALVAAYRAIGGK